MRNEIICALEFADAEGKIAPLTFRDPIRIITAERIEEVIPAIRKVEEAVDDGFYAAGYLSYESAPAFEPAFLVNEEPTMPLLWFGLFEYPVAGSLESDGHYSMSDWKPNVSREEYGTSITAIRQAIEDGITYQTNYTIRLEADFNGDEKALFTKMKRAQSSGYSAYLNIGSHHILSASPELFFHKKGNRITTRPMKGTLKRGLTSDEDKANREWLFHSEKNRAENVMIVDLLRNDLGRIADPGSVKVTKLFDIEKYPTVLQMTSTVEATIASDKSFVDIFGALFPCGSITGAPKISTMEVISAIEQAPRGVYCGAIGFITPDKEAVFNVPIRTMTIEKSSGKATYGVGGGITWDSTAEDEYEEVLTKASFLKADIPEFDCLESILLEYGSFFLLEEHIQRLKNSARYFNFDFNEGQIRFALENVANSNPEGMFKIRLLLNRNGEFNIEKQPILIIQTPVKAGLANEPIDQGNPFLYNKTTNREIYRRLSQPPTEFFDTLLWNEKGELTEFCNGNLVVEMDGEKWTPPVRCGLLAGTYRNALIAELVIKEKIIHKSDLPRCTKIWSINSVRRWLEVSIP